MLDNMQRLRGELAPVDVADFCGLQRFIETGYESDHATRMPMEIRCMAYHQLAVASVCNKSFFCASSHSVESFNWLCIFVDAKIH